MKKNLLFLLTIVGIPAIALAANVGDCLNSTAVGSDGDGYWCDPDTSQPCGQAEDCKPTSGNCNTSGDGTRKFLVMDNIRNHGDCVSTYSNHRCTKCGKFHCATTSGYMNEDANGQCNGSCSITGTYYFTNVCVLP